MLQQYIVTFFDPTPESYVDVADDGSYYDRQVDGSCYTTILKLTKNPNWNLILNAFRIASGNPNWRIEQAYLWEPHLMEF